VPVSHQKHIIRLALVGDFSPAVTAHRAINASLGLAESTFSVEGRWLHTSTIVPSQPFDSFDAIWCVPNSPYANTEGALWAIEWARTRRVPFLGTCGGFQHALMEFVRNVLNRKATHAELDPDASNPVISRLACALVEKSESIHSTGRGKFAQSYGGTQIEGFCCSFGLNPTYESLLEGSGLETVARGESGAVRAVELRGHPFFVGTLFQPERRALKGELHPLIAAFLSAAAEARISSC
jgi:CTP synthase (UTP-ammonia lyase)